MTEQEYLLLEEKPFGVIYLIVNIVNNKKYIGQTKNFILRKKDHEKVSNIRKSLIDRKINQYKKENFLWEILDACSSKEELDEKERLRIEQYKTLVKYGRGYNVRGGGNKSHSLEGKPYLEKQEIYAKISKTLAGRSSYEGKTEEQILEIKKKKSKKLIGKNPYAGKSEEEMRAIRQKMSLSHLGKSHYDNKTEEEAKLIKERNRNKMLGINKGKNPYKDKSSNEKNEIYKNRKYSNELYCNKKPVMCIETGEVYIKMLDAINQKYGGKKKGYFYIRDSIKTGKQHKGLSWKEIVENQ